MSKSFTEIARHPARFGALAALAIAVAVLALLIARLDTEAVHNEGLLEVDGDVAFQTGTGFDPGTNNCNPFSVNGPDNGDPDDCINTAASFDWADNTSTTGAQGLCARGGDGYITEASPLPSALPAGASIDSIICQADFYQTATDDTSYHTGSDKDYQDISGPEPVWHCTDSANATSKADILNAAFAVTTSGGDDQVVYFGAERDSEHGSVYNGFWILQSDIGVPDATTSDADQLDCSGAGSPFNFSGVHVCGDVLVLFNYESGGRVGKIGAFQWVNGTISDGAGGVGCDRDGDTVADATCTAAEQADADSVALVPGPGFLCVKFTSGSGDCRSVLSFGDDLCGRVNGATDCTIAPKQNTPEPPPCSGPGSFAAPWEPDDGDPASNVVEPPTFSEVGVNLSDLGLELPCIAALVAESRSAPSTTATLKDFVSVPTGEDCESDIRTEIHDVANHGDTDSDIQGTTVYRGTVIHDAAFITPTGPGSAPNATGSVTFTLFSNGDCDAGEGDVNVISTETKTITDQIAAGIPVNTEGQIDSSTFDTDDTTATEISYTASADLDDPYADSVLAAEDCETLSIITPSTTLDKSLAFSIEVTYSYSETNDGDDPLTSPSVSDPVCVANGGTVSDVDVTPADGFNDGDTNTDGVLDPGETFLFECTVTLTEADLDSFPVTNIATGHGTDSLGRDVTFCAVGAGTPTPAPGPNNGQFCDPDETDSTSIDITVDQGKP